jgi:hypothetical protein
MPLKRGSIIDADVINPLFCGNDNAERRRIIDRYRNFIVGDRIDIWIKRQNTLKFLTVAEAASEKFWNDSAAGQ